MRHASIFMGIMFIGLLIAGCVTIENNTNTGETGQSGLAGPGQAAGLQADDSGLLKFNSTSEIMDYLQQAQASGSYYGYGINSMARDMAEPMAEGVASDSAMVKTSSLPASAPQASGVSGTGQSSAGATDYSTTNVQVQGVDEADFVKNDGKYIYMVDQNRLIIADAYPPEDAKIEYQGKLPGMPREMFLNGDRLAVFVDENTQSYGIQPYDFMPTPRYMQETDVLIYDISDRENPELVKNYTVTGSYYQSRMIGDYVYFIAQDSVYYYNNYIDLPIIKESGAVVARPDIYYFPNPENNYVFDTVSSFDINDDKAKINSKTYMMGYSNTLYVSENSIYITYQKNMPWSYQEKDREDRFYNVIVPLLPSDVQSKIKAIKAGSGEDYEKWVRISEVMQDMYDSMSDTQVSNLVDKISDAVDEYETKKEIDRRKTVIHKIDIDNGKIEYDTSGEVPGYLLNQFSLDESGGNLRVATTTYTYTSRKSSMFNNVYVLDKNLKIIGKLENIAPDENIYSTRFLGDRLYMVTFKRIDPLFVIGLSDPKNPVMLGELKIPGYSDYLHPYDETHLIGIGKETGTNEWGGTSTKGVKLALFDVSDVSNPKLLDSYEIGDMGTDSEALSDHRAFLFDKEKNLLVIPISEVEQRNVYDRTLGYYLNKVWQGAYVFGVTPEDGFVLKGKISHQEGLEQYYYYYTGGAVRRALYMDDVLYTVSGKKILANDLSKNLEQVAEIDLPYDRNKVWYWY